MRCALPASLTLICLLAALAGGRWSRSRWAPASAGAAAAASACGARCQRAKPPATSSCCGRSGFRGSRRRVVGPCSRIGAIMQAVSLAGRSALVAFPPGRAGGCRRDRVPDSQFGQSLRLCSTLLPIAGLRLAGHDGILIRSQAARANVDRDVLLAGLRLPPLPMPASGYWYSSPTIASCVTSRSGCWAR